MKTLLGFVLLFPWSLLITALVVVARRPGRPQNPASAWKRFRGLEELSDPRPRVPMIPSADLVMFLRRGAA